jgi:hypothetical protein
MYDGPYVYAVCSSFHRESEMFRFSWRHNCHLSHDTVMSGLDPRVATLRKQKLLEFTLGM